MAGFLALDQNGDGTDDGPYGTDGRDGRTGQTGRTGGNTVLEYYWDGEIQFYSTTGTEKYSFTVLLGQRIEEYFRPKYCLTVICFNILNLVLSRKNPGRSTTNPGKTKNWPLDSCRAGFGRIPIENPLG